MRQFGTNDEGTQQSRQSPKATGLSDQIFHQLIDAVGPKVGELGLQMVPHQFVGIDLRCVGGKAFHVQPRMAGEEGSDVGTAVNRAAVPEQNDVSLEMPQEQAQEDRHFNVGDVVEMEVRVEIASLGPRTDAYGRDRRDAVVLITMT